MVPLSLVTDSANGRAVTSAEVRQGGHGRSGRKSTWTPARWASTWRRSRRIASQSAAGARARTESPRTASRLSEMVGRSERHGVPTAGPSAEPTATTSASGTHRSRRCRGLLEDSEHCTWPHDYPVARRLATGMTTSTCNAEAPNCKEPTSPSRSGFAGSSNPPTPGCRTRTTAPTDRPKLDTPLASPPPCSSSANKTETAAPNDRLSAQPLTTDSANGRALQAQKYDRGVMAEAVANRPGHRLTVLYTACGGHRLCGPNDLVFDADGGLWFTDRGKSRADEVDRAGRGRSDRRRLVEVRHQRQRDVGTRRPGQHPALPDPVAALGRSSALGQGPQRSSTTGDSGGGLGGLAGGGCQALSGVGAEGVDELVGLGADHAGAEGGDPAGDLVGAAQADSGAVGAFVGTACRQRRS